MNTANRSDLRFALRRLLPCRSGIFKNVETVEPIEQINPSVAVEKHIVGLHGLVPRAGCRDIVTNLFGLMRIGDIDDPESAAKPGEINQTVGHALMTLVRA